MNRGPALTILLVILSILVGLTGCQVETRFDLDERIDRLRSDILNERKKIEQIKALDADIEHLRQRLKEAKTRNSRRLADDPDLARRLRKHYPEAESLPHK